MKPVLQGKSFTPSESEHISCVRLHLQVATLSDISDGNGQTVNQDIMAGQRPTDHQSPRAWPRQPSVTTHQVKLWAKYLRTHFFTTEEGLHLRHSLGQWTSDSNLEWRYTKSPTNVLFDTTRRLQAIPVRLSRRSATFSVWQHVSRITTITIPATCIQAITAGSCIHRHDGSGSTADPHTYLVRSSLAASTPWPQAAVAEV